MGCSSITGCPAYDEKTQSCRCRMLMSLTSIKGALSWWSCCLLVKTAQIFDKELVCNMNCCDYTRKKGFSPRKNKHFHPSDLQLSIVNSTGSFCALVGLLLRKRDHYFNNFIETNVFCFFLLFIVTLKIVNTAPFNWWSTCHFKHSTLHQGHMTWSLYFSY